MSPRPSPTPESARREGSPAEGSRLYGRAASLAFAAVLLIGFAGACSSNLSSESGPKQSGKAGTSSDSTSNSREDSTSRGSTDSQHSTTSDGTADGKDSKAGDSGATDTAASTSGTCTGTNVTGSTSSGPFKATSAAAVSLMSGSAYTLYLSDFDIDAASLTMYSKPEPTAEQSLFTAFVGVLRGTQGLPMGAPIKVGQEIDYSDDMGVLALLVTAESGGKDYGVNSGASGKLTVTSVGDKFCGTIEYRDDEKSLKGSFEAAVKRL